MATNTLTSDSRVHAGRRSAAVDRMLLSDGLAHAGGGTVLVLTYLGVMIPGFFVVLVLAVAVAALSIAPLLALALAAAAIAGPPYGLWRLARGTRKDRRPIQPAAQLSPAPTPHTS
jgi:hypothetical protein